VNLFLAVTGRRPDGFHELLSVAAPVDFGDTLEACPNSGARDTLECRQPEVPTGDDNLVLRAAAAWRAAGGRAPTVHFVLGKWIPMGAGLGGGSSNAVAALRALQQLGTAPLPPDRLAAVAAQVGSDCPLFLAGGPVVLRGRGEQVEPLTAAGATRLSGRLVVIYKPLFAVATPWAYSRLAAGAPGSYLPAATAEARLRAWIESEAPAEQLLFNSFTGPVGDKFVALPVLARRLEERLGLRPLLTGSGSASFVLVANDAEAEAVAELVAEAWGPHAFVRVARIL
jgi:4-diphosphocytidyl-2-C-methyl-D-erythritol kinase